VNLCFATEAADQSHPNPAAERGGMPGGIKSEHEPGADVREIATRELPDNYLGSLFQDHQGRIWLFSRMQRRSALAVPP
jgi:hypothetical protein